MAGELHIPTRVEGENKWRTNGWTEMQTLPEDSIPSVKYSSPSKMTGIINFSPSKLANNQTTNSNDPMAENLLNDNLEVTHKKEVIKRIAGGSDTTSGCESGETESLEKDCSVENNQYDADKIEHVRPILDEEVNRMSDNTLTNPSNCISTDMEQNAHSPSFQNKHLPRPPTLIKSSLDRAYVRSPEHSNQLAYRESHQEVTSQFANFAHTPVNNHQFESYDVPHNASYLPVNGYTKAIHVNGVQTNPSILRTTTGSPVTYNSNDPHITASEGHRQTQQSGYVITGNSTSHPLPTAILQLDQCSSLSSSTSGVSSNTPSASSQNNQGNTSNSYVAFSAVCNDECAATGRLSPPSGFSGANPSNTYNSQNQYRSFPLESPRRENLPRPPVVPVAKGYISVAQANHQILSAPINATRAHEEGYSRVVMPEGRSGPPSLSAAYIDNSALYELRSGDSKSLARASEISTKNSFHENEDAFRDQHLRPFALSSKQDSQDYTRSTACNPNESQNYYVKSASFANENDLNGKKLSDTTGLPSLVISPNNLIERNRDVFTGNHSSYVSQSSEAQANLNNHLNVVATLDGDRQSTMV